MRSEAQKEAFALSCREIEKKGGDVLGYIQKNYPSYTPRATWYNLQKQFLNRQTCQLTDGKKINPEERRMQQLKANKGKQLDDVLKILEEGKDPIEYLEGLGYKVPTQAWADLKIWARKHRPDDRNKMPDNLRLYYAEHNLVNKTGKVHEHNQNRVPPPPPAPQKDVDNVFFGGKEYERYEGDGKPVNSYREKPSPTCCQPARESGVTVPDEVPALPEMLTVCGVMGSYGRFEQNIELKGERYMTFVMHMQLTNEDIRITFSADQWKTMLKEIPIALRQLGLSK